MSHGWSTPAWLPTELEPKLLAVLKEGVSRHDLVHDLLAGLVVGIVALPLAIEIRKPATIAGAFVVRVFSVLNP